MFKVFKNRLFSLFLWLVLLAGIFCFARWCYYRYLDYQQDKLAQELTVHDKIFTHETLVQMAQSLAQKPFIPPKSDLPSEVEALDYDQHRDIRFVRENGPWFNKKLKFEMQFFHLGSLFKTSIPINEIIKGKSHPIPYSSAFFYYGKNKLDPNVLNGIGYAGFRLHYPLNSSDYYDELIAFLGASYFRALGQGQKYGLSARGLAIDTALQTGEEFPIFREFWMFFCKRPQKAHQLRALAGRKVKKNAVFNVLHVKLNHQA